MRSLRLIARSAVYYRSANAGLLLGTSLAAAILTGALVVGDSVDHTLRTFALQRLGSIEFAVTASDRLFSSELGKALGATLTAPVSTMLALPGMAIYQNPATGERTQVNRVQALGVDERFWSFGEGPAIELGRREAAIDARLAAALGAKVGDTVALRISKPGLLSRDAPLSSREEESSQRANFTVKAVVLDSQMGRFGLTANQIPPSNFFVGISDLEQLAASEGLANLMLVGKGSASDGVEIAIEDAWTPAYAGLQVRARTEQVLQLESDRIFIDDTIADAALQPPGSQGALTYLVNGIRNGDRFTPYSFMTATGALDGTIRDDEIVINAWLAEQLNARVGDRVTVTYYEVLPSNRFEERSREFTVNRVDSMEAFATEKQLVPEFPGLSNVESCRDWKIGMPMDEELLKDEANEGYWDTYRETPKALVTLAAGQAMWANRFGRLTAVRFDRSSTTAESILASLGQRLRPRDAGFEVRAVRSDAEAAASQAMDLGGLFLGMSFFLLASALLLTGLLYAFGAQQRAAEVGVYAALGFTRRRIGAILLCEALVVAVPGALVGAMLGMGYAWLLLIGLTYLWQDAIGRIPVLFNADPQSIVIGACATVLCALVAASLTLRRLLAHNTSELLQADFTQEPGARPVGARGLIVAIATLLAAAELVGYAVISPPSNVAGLFFGSGFLALVSGLLFVRHLLFRSTRSPFGGLRGMFTLARLNATRRRWRSIGIVTSLAAGGFLVLATSSMQTDVSANADQRWSGTGGFALFAESTVPILNPDELDQASPGVAAVGLRVFDGDDASCLNLNQAIRPRVLGVDVAQMKSLGAFTGETGAGLWDLLHKDCGEGVIPALVGDSDTAMWTLKKKTDPEHGDTLEYRDELGRDIRIRLVGRLPMRLSVFQGTILVSAHHFTELWPSREGFRVFLLDVPANAQGEHITRLQRAFDRYGLDVVASTERLEMFHAVEGTYLNMFLVLGGIGLLLGATATGVVVLRNLLERRREIALLRAVGFSPRTVFRLLVYEYGMLLVLGIVAGGVASAIAMAPALTPAHAGGSPLWRLLVLVAVFAGASLCALAAIAVGLRKTGPEHLRAE